MIKTYSTVTGKYYDSMEAATAAEKKIEEERVAAEKVKAEVADKISAIRKQRDAEIAACREEKNSINAKIDELLKKRSTIDSDIQHIIDEAALEIDDLTVKPQCSIKVKTFDSNKDSDWKTVVDEKNISFKDLISKMKSVNGENELKSLLKLFDI